jgi:hypothetical protein
MELSSLELSSSIESLRDRGLAAVNNTRHLSAEFVDRTQRLTTEWLVENERRLLHGVLEALREIDARIQRRLEHLSQIAFDDARGDDQVDGSTYVALPFEDYDLYTAKEIIAELSELTADAAKAVLEYEKAHKARATVIRAAEQRLVA